ncbi:hypothetical protein [Bosea sp. OK403]|uniref:hypothetical protein n=1 Tax=Bosea sp. OK403 TaxID=1855286 RepID=UPI001113DCF9|nr:hypothetical protein [Bosea sp. OK403]
MVARNLSWWQRLTSDVGDQADGYAKPAVTPLLRRWLELWSSQTVDFEGSIGFARGLVGMTICEALIRWARRWRYRPISFPPPSTRGDDPL